MEYLIRRISSRTGGKAQIYLPDQRPVAFTPRALVKITLVRRELERAARPYYRNIRHIEPWKVSLIQQIFTQIEPADNVLITGSFLETGNAFQDVDVILITEASLNPKQEEKALHETIGLPFHVIHVKSYTALKKAAERDPLFQAMLSQFVSKKIVPSSLFSITNNYDYKLLDLHLLQSEFLFNNFGYSGGNEKYKLVRNLIAILLFLERRNITTHNTNLEIEHQFGKGTTEALKMNALEEQPFMKKYKHLYNTLQKRILQGVSHAAKQENPH